MSVSRRLRQSLLLFHVDLPLNAELSRRFIDEKAFRELARAVRGNRWKKVGCLNLGPDFWDYLMYSAQVHAGGDARDASLEQRWRFGLDWHSNVSWSRIRILWSD